MSAPISFFEGLQRGFETWLRNANLQLQNPWFWFFIGSQAGIALIFWIFRYRISEWFAEKFPDSSESYTGEEGLEWSNQQFERLKKSKWWKD